MHGKLSLKIISKKKKKEGKKKEKKDRKERERKKKKQLQLLFICLVEIPKDNRMLSASILFVCLGEFHCAFTFIYVSCFKQSKIICHTVHFFNFLFLPLSFANNSFFFIFFCAGNSLRIDPRGFLQIGGGKFTCSNTICFKNTFSFLLTL